MDRKLQRHRADSLRQHGFLVTMIIADTRHNICLHLHLLAVATEHITPCLRKKTSKIIFVITMSNFHQIWQFLAQRWQRVKLCEVHLTSPLALSVGQRGRCFNSLRIGEILWFFTNVNYRYLTQCLKTRHLIFSYDFGNFKILHKQILNNLSLLYTRSKTSTACALCVCVIVWK